MAGQSLQQKKLQTLQKQLYGGSEKSRKSSVGSLQPNPTNVFSLDQINTQPTFKKESTEDNIYLKKDLFKVLILSSIILGLQFLTYYAMQVNLLPAWI